MSTVQHIEYYSTCPSCGAVRAGSDTCEYCGGSLIKRTTFVESDYDPDEILKAQDAQLPVIQGKLCGDNAFLKIFCSIFSSCFLLVPTVIFLSFCLAGIPVLPVFLFCLLFWVIGIGSLVPLINSIRNKKRCQGGQVLTGQVRGYEDGSYLVNNQPVQTMRIRLNAADGQKLLLLSTGESKKSYSVGAQITLRNYENHYLIEG